MNDQTFKDLVAEDVKGRSTADQQAYLALPENLETWESVLLELIHTLDEQIAANQAAMTKDSALYEALGPDGLKLKVESEIAYMEQCRKIVRFKHHVEKRLNHVSRLLSIQENSTDQSKAKMVDFLTLGIRRYLDQGSADTRHLEALLRGEWTFDA